MDLIRPTATPRVIAGRAFVAAPGDDAWSLTGVAAESLVTAAGAGGLSHDGLAVTRFSGDLLRQAQGTFVYLRDLESGRLWSAGWQPTAVQPVAYQAQCEAGVVRIVRIDDEIQSTLEIAVTPDDVELRRCTLHNLGSRPRQVEATSYLEWILQDEAADQSHPAFSKLFVETSIDQASRAIFAHRRRRSPEQSLLAGVHWIADVQGELLEAMQYETCRTAFLGRGFSLQRPRGLATLSTRLAGKSGPVLDPIAAGRGVFFLAPNESATIVFATAARSQRRALAAVIDGCTPASIAAAFGEPGHEQDGAIAGNFVNDDVPGDDDASATAPLDGAADGRERRVDQAHSAAAGQFVRAADHPQHDRRTDPDGLPPLLFDNGIGGFTSDGCEYVLRLAPGVDGKLQLPPLPWVNVAANEVAGFIATETGAGYTWTANSRENRLTPWHNDPVLDPHGEALYLRDRQRRRFWSPTPGPAGPLVLHEVRHGFGYTQYRQESEGLRHTTLMFVPRGDAVKLTRLTLENQTSATREFDCFAWAEFALGNGTRDMATGGEAWFDDETQAVFARNERRDAKNRIAFFALAGAACGAPDRRVHHSCDLGEFLGPYGDPAAPLAVREGRTLQGGAAAEGPACAALQAELSIAAHDSVEVVVLLGEADSIDEARGLISHYRSVDAVDRAFVEVRESWRHRLAAVQIETPSQPLNLMVNGWLPYQNLSCRMWARSAYYQAGGAYGFRDQLQDSSAYVYHWPQLTRAQILRHASHQFVEGDVLHWWHPPASRGLRTRFADDLLWLPMIAAEYCAATGDAALWDVRTPYLTGPALDEGEDERFMASEFSGEEGTVYEHCCRAIDRSLAVGSHGLPLMGCGDWNDGMNRIGRDGGESVWMGFFLCYVLDRFAPVCRARGDIQHAEEYAAHRRILDSALNDAGWDGQWYRRAFFADGTAVGSSESAECRIDALAQAWAVLSGVAPADRAATAVAAVEEQLVDAQQGLIKLLTPPFDKSPHDPGYIQGYVPGVRENGGQYTHGVLWFIRALAELGRGSRAVELLEMLTPIRHGDSAERVARYQAEPYVVAADVYGQAPHEGRAGWTWYTGSAGWMFRVAVESILGFTTEAGQWLVLNPSISADWPRCRLTYRPDDRGTVYEIAIENPLGRERGVRQAALDGEMVEVSDGVARVPLVRDGRLHDVRIEL